MTWTLSRAEGIAVDDYGEMIGTCRVFRVNQGVVSLPFVSSPKFLTGLKVLCCRPSPAYLPATFSVALPASALLLLTSRPFWASCDGQTVLAASVLPSPRAAAGPASLLSLFLRVAMTSSLGTCTALLRGPPPELALRVCLLGSLVLSAFPTSALTELRCHCL